MANVQKATGHGHFLDMKNSAYNCPYDLASNRVNAIYIVYKIRKYEYWYRAQLPILLRNGR